MPNRNFKATNITVNKHKFRLEFYGSLVDWEIFPNQLNYHKILNETYVCLQ